MLMLHPAVRYYLYREDTDMRKGFDGLSGIVRNALSKDPLTGDIFIFVNRRRNQVKLLLFEGDGFSIYHKRLERGTYELPEVLSKEVVLSCDELQFILQGVSLNSIRKRKRFVIENYSKNI